MFAKKKIQAARKSLHPPLVKQYQNQYVVKVLNAG